MKAAIAQKIARKICFEMPGLVEKGRLLFMTPMGHILRGFYLENSQNAEAFYMWAFVQPLYVPSTTLTFTLGTRLGGGAKTWSLTEPLDELLTLMRNEGMPLLQLLASPKALARWHALNHPSSPYACEAKAYSLVASGQIAEGIEALRDLRKMLPDETAWMIDTKDRAETLARLAEASLASARELLTRWERDTCRQIGVPISDNLSWEVA